MASEVSELCGPKHHPTESECCRAGTSPCRVLFEGEREDVIRPRVRNRYYDGSREEVVLETCRTAGDPTQLQESIRQRLGDKRCPLANAPRRRLIYCVYDATFRPSLLHASQFSNSKPSAASRSPWLGSSGQCVRAVPDLFEDQGRGDYWN
ncbi:MAG: hypothetical protein ACI87E_002069 [Mariniblastus sp.]|jgi:hypothetical protein